MVTFTEKEMNLAFQGAKSAHSSARGLLPLDDLVQEARLWMVSHPDKVETWRDEGRHGGNKLRKACRQHCLTVVQRERRLQSGLRPGDSYFYSPAVIADLLPYIWDATDWIGGSAVTLDDVRSLPRPSEGNNRLAIIADVRSAYQKLQDQDQVLLSLLHQHGGETYESVALMLDVHERTIRRREERIIDRMVELLGGENPWKR